MFNPFPRFELKYLNGFRQKGVVAFVKQTYDRGRDPHDKTEKPAFLLSHYNEPHMARNHFDAIAHDVNRQLLEIDNSEDWKELERLGAQESGAIVYMYFKLPDAEQRAKKVLDTKLHAYIDHKLKWRVSRSEGVQFGLEFTFGEIYAVLKSGGRTHKVKIEEIETTKGYVL